MSPVDIFIPSLTAEPFPAFALSIRVAVVPDLPELPSIHFFMEDYYLIILIVVIFSVVE